MVISIMYFSQRIKLRIHYKIISNNKVLSMICKQSFSLNPYLHSVEIPAMISASYRGGGASDHAEGFFRQKKNTMERQGC